jgi:FMN-dependent NADH-azoreductase
MRTLLQLNSSIFSGNGQSSQLADKFVASWKADNVAGRVVVRDLAANPVPHLDAQRFGAFLAKPEERTAEQKVVADFSDALIDEIRRADVIVIGLPMYNFGLPSTLKAYFDHIARAGITFRYTANGPEGLLKGKKVYVFAARGGLYAGTPLDTQTSYVKNFLRFLGMDDVQFVYAEGLAISAESKEASLSAARKAIEQIGVEEAVAA